MSITTRSKREANSIRDVLKLALEEMDVALMQTEPRDFNAHLNAAEGHVATASDLFDGCDGEDE